MTSRKAKTALDVVQNLKKTRGVPVADPYTVELMMSLVRVCWKMMGVGDAVDDAAFARSEEPQDPRRSSRPPRPTAFRNSRIVR